jgi:hypothetical protein
MVLDKQGNALRKNLFGTFFIAGGNQMAISKSDLKDLTKIKHNMEYEPIEITLLCEKCMHCLKQPDGDLKCVHPEVFKTLAKLRQEGWHDCPVFKDKEVGFKYDGDKPRWELLRWGFIEEIVQDLTFGAKKYGPNNWEKVDNGIDRYFAAAMRHLIAFRKGEQIDPESGLSHLAMAGCNLMFLWELNSGPEKR